MASTTSNSSNHAGVASHYAGSNSSAPLQSPDTVGNQFVTQYYHVKHINPKFLHRFYTDTSQMSILGSHGFDQGGLPSTMAKGQQNIHEEFMLMNFQSGKTWISHTHSQYSQGDGVMVTVVGSVQLAGQEKRDFTQTFFLAVQEKGYFVLNDIFVYMPTAQPALQPPMKAICREAARQFGWGMQDARLPVAAPPPVEAVPQASAHPPAPPPVMDRSTRSTNHTGVSQSAEPGAGGTRPHVSPPPPPGVAPLPMATHPAAGPAQPMRQQHPPAPAHAAPPPSQAPIRPPVASIPQPPVPAAVTPAPGPSQAEPPAPPPASQAPAAVRPAPAMPAAVPAVKPADAQPPQQQTKPPRNVPVQESKAPSSSGTVAEVQAVEPPVQRSSPPPAPARPQPTPKATVQEPKIPAAAPAAAPPPPAEEEKVKYGAKSWAAVTAQAPKSQAVQKPAAPVEAPPAATPPAGPNPAARPPPAVPAPAPVPSAAAPAPTNGNKSNGLARPPASEPEITSIFVRGFSDTVDSAQLLEIFGKFGPVKNGLKGISLKLQRGKEHFAFIEFETVAAMEKAISSPPTLEGKQLWVVKKRLHFLSPGGNYAGRGNMRGGFRGGGGGRRGGLDGGHPAVEVENQPNGNMQAAPAPTRVDESGDADVLRTTPAISAEGNGAGRPKPAGRENGYRGRSDRGRGGGRGEGRGEGRGDGRPRPRGAGRAAPAPPPPVATPMAA